MPIANPRPLKEHGRHTEGRDGMVTNSALAIFLSILFLSTSAMSIAICHCAVFSIPNVCNSVFIRCTSVARQPSATERTPTPHGRSRWHIDKLCASHLFVYPFFVNIRHVYFRSPSASYRTFKNSSAIRIECESDGLCFGAFHCFLALASSQPTNP